MRISVIMVAYKNCKVLLDCLQSIAKYNDIGADLEIIVVDHSPAGETVESIFEYSGCKKIIYCHHENKGEGSGNNFGAQFATGEILVFLDTDIILIEPVFDKMRKQFQQNSQLAMLGVQFLDTDLQPIFSYGYRAEYVHNATPFFEQQSKKYNLFDAKTMFFLGAAIIMRADVFNKIGGYDEKFFLYNEDQDMMKRMLENIPQYQVKFCSDIRMIHLWGGSGVDEETGYRYTLESIFYYLAKYHFEPYKFFLDTYTQIQWDMLLAKKAKDGGKMIRLKTMKKILLDVGLKYFPLRKQKN